MRMRILYTVLGYFQIVVHGSQTGTDDHPLVFVQFGICFRSDCAFVIGCCVTREFYQHA